MIAENLNAIRERIAAAEKRAGRDAGSVKLIAVSKYKPVPDLKEAYDAGVRNFGENHVQELVGKIPAFGSDVSWHMIGVLQRNKVKYIAGSVSLIHSVDSVKLAEQIEKEAAKKGIIQEILLEVNVADEESKSGFCVDEVLNAVTVISAFEHVRIKGLMTVAPFVDDPEENRPVFRKLHDLFVDIQKRNMDNVCMCELSMGMSGDFETAIEEGATMVRIGTSIFGKRNYDKV